MIGRTQPRLAVASCQAELMQSARYRLVVQGELSARYASAFEGMIREHGGGTTAIVGAVEDQSHVLGLLERVAGVGLTLVSLTPEDTTVILRR